MVRSWVVALVVLAALVGLPSRVSAHCDTLDGPVVSAARLALERGELQPVLKWVKPEAEDELGAAFRQATAVRGQGGAARDLADRYFFETVVRLHRAGEGAPYTGLKPAGSTEKPVAAADQALEQDSVQSLSGMLTDHLAAGLRERFTRVLAARADADRSAEAGRRYVAAYVEFVHYVESIAGAVHGAAAHGHPAAAEQARK